MELVPGHLHSVWPLIALREDDAIAFNQHRLFLEQKQTAQMQTNGFMAHIKSFRKLLAYLT
jgi:hypothetical protein